MFSWLRDRHRREVLNTPFPPAWLEFLRRNVAFYARLSRSEQARLRDDLQVLVAEKNWEGCGGLTMTEEVQVTVAAQACLMLLGLSHDEYADVASILVYPDDYQVVQKTAVWQSPFGNAIITEEPSGRRGQASSWGTAVLSWTGVLSGGRQADAGVNLVFHEFAHVLDFQDGRFDGVPRLHDKALSAEWAEVMAAEFQALVRATQDGQTTVLRPYGATNAGEFFAVSTECFFGKAGSLRDAHPRLYKVLRAFYQQDPAARLDRQHAWNVHG